MADFTLLRIPFRPPSSPTIRLFDGAIKYLDQSPFKDKVQVEDYPRELARRRVVMPDVHHMFLALLDESVFLSTHGELLLAAHDANEEPFMKPVELQSAVGWQSGTGGVIFDSLFLVDRNGSLQQAKVTHTLSADGDDDRDNRSYSLEPLQFTSRLKLKKFAQGLKVQAAAGMSGEVFLWTKDGRPARRSLSVPVQDIAVIQEVETREALGRTDGVDQVRLRKFALACGIADPDLRPDPWLGRGLGFNSARELVIAGDHEGECVRLGSKPLESRVPYLDEGTTR